MFTDVLAQKRHEERALRITIDFLQAFRCWYHGIEGLLRLLPYFIVVLGIPVTVVMNFKLSHYAAVLSALVILIVAFEHRALNVRLRRALKIGRELEDDLMVYIEARNSAGLDKLRIAHNQPSNAAFKDLWHFYIDPSSTAIIDTSVANFESRFGKVSKLFEVAHVTRLLCSHFAVAILIASSLLLLVGFARH